MNIEIKDNYSDEHHMERKQFIASVRKLSLSKEKRWIKTMVKNNKIYMGSYLETSSQKRAFLKSMFAMIDALNEAHGSDWDMHLQIRNYGSRSSGLPTQFELIPIIRFKEFTIRNSNGSERQLHDIIVYIPLSCGETITHEGEDYMIIYPERPRGTKASWTTEEYHARYVHSHLTASTPDRSNVFKTERFCVGNGEIQDLTQELQNNFDPNLFRLYLLMIDTLVKWESLEGRPHMYMERISTRQVTSTHYSEGFIRDGFQATQFDFIGNNFKPTLLLHNNRFIIEQNEYLEKFIKKILINRQLYKYLVKKRGTSQIYVSYAESANIPMTTEEVVGDEVPYTIISGEKIYFKMINTNNRTDEDVNTFKVHPKLIEYVATKFESALLKTSVRDKYVAPEDRIVDTRQS